LEPLGIVSGVKALMSGRVFDDGNVEGATPSGVYGNTWLYHNVESKTNYAADKAMLDVKIQNVTGRAMMSSGGKTLKIDDRILQLSDSATTDYLTDIKQLLRRVNTAQPSVTATATPAALPYALVGGDCLLSLDNIYDLYSGARGVTLRAAMMTSVSTSLNKNRMATALTFRFTPDAKGIAPSLRLEDANMSLDERSSTVTVTGLATVPDDNDFANPLPSPNGLTDLAYFGCINYDAGSDSRKLRDCSCSSYAVIILDENTTSWDTGGADCNVWHGRLLGSATDTLTLADITNGACRITLDADPTEFDDTTNKIVIFEDWDDADLQTCQKVYGWLGDEIGQIDDGSDTSQGMTWS